jgi:hypothetical protein
MPGATGFVLRLTIRPERLPAEGFCDAKLTHRKDEDVF